MHQVKLRYDYPDEPGTYGTMVGYVKPQYAVRNTHLRIGGRMWRVIAVYGRERSDFIAWWFKVGT